MSKRDGIQERRKSDGTASYRAQVRVRGFPPVGKTFRRKTDAKRWIEETKTAIRGGTMASTEAARTTLREALERFLKEVTPHKKGRKREEDRIKAWMRHPLSLRFLSQLRGTDFVAYREKRRAEGKKSNTIRIELGLISHLYKVAAKDWGMDGLRNPIQHITLPAGSNKRNRRLEAQEEAVLLAELRKAGPYMAPLAELAIETAMRQGELLALTWADIDPHKRIAYLKDTKNSEPRDVPLSTRALRILEELPRPIASAAPLFPLKQALVIRTFRQACSDAKLQNLRFHDLRHEAVTRICDRLPMHEAMRVTGHKTPSLLMRYYHPKAEDLARKLA